LGDRTDYLAPKKTRTTYPKCSLSEQVGEKIERKSVNRGLPEKWATAGNILPVSLSMVSYHKSTLKAQHNQKYKNKGSK